MGSVHSAVAECSCSLRCFNDELSIDSAAFDIRLLIGERISYTCA